MSRTWLRAGLIFLAAAQGAAGITQLFWPRWFYTDFPWVSLLPPYNEHLMRDVGAGTLAYVLVLAVAAVSLERRLVRTALASTLIFTVAHFAFHATHLDNYTGREAVEQTITLAVGVVLPIVLFVLHEVGLRRAPVE